jgi:hypothetical protein
VLIFLLSLVQGPTIDEEQKGFDFSPPFIIRIGVLFFFLLSPFFFVYEHVMKSRTKSNTIKEKQNTSENKGEEQ